MGLRFRRSLKIFPGVRLNFSGSGVSTSVGVRGAHLTFGHGHVRESVGLPGTGISYTTTSKVGQSHPGRQESVISPGGWIVALILGIVVFAMLAGTGSHQQNVRTPSVAMPEPTTSKPAATAVATVAKAEPREAKEVAVDALNERDQPNGNVVGILHRGALVDVFETREGWARISDVDHAPRWVYARLLTERAAAQ